MRKLLFLINPHAGRAEIKTRALEAIDLFVKAGWEPTVRTTQRPLEIPELLEARANEFELVVCCGGDGTLNETVSGLMQCDPRPLLGYIPAGTVNDFAYSLGLSKNIREASQAIVEGTPFPCDVGRFGDRYFSYIAAFGAFTDVSYQTPQESKCRLGRAAYILEGIRRLPTIKTYRMSITHDGGQVEGDFLFGMVSNAISVGGFRLHEDFAISMNDGLLEVLLVRSPEDLTQTRSLIRASLQQELDSEYLVSLRTSHLLCEAEEEVPWTLDGEYGGSLRSVEVRNCHQAIRVLRPKPMPAKQGQANP